MADSPKNPASPIFSRRNLIWGGGGAVAATWLASMFPTGYSPSPPELELEVIITPSPLSPETATNTLKALFAHICASPESGLDERLSGEQIFNTIHALNKSGADLNARVQGAPNSKSEDDVWIHQNKPTLLMLAIIAHGSCKSERRKKVLDDFIITIVAEGADINAVSQHSKSSALHNAVIQNNVDMVKMLVTDSRLIVNPVDADGYTPIDYATTSDIKALLNERDAKHSPQYLKQKPQIHTPEERLKKLQKPAGSGIV